MCFTWFFYSSWMTDSKSETSHGLLTAQIQFFLLLPPVNSKQNTKKWTFLTSACARSLMCRKNPSTWRFPWWSILPFCFLVKAGGCDWCSEASSVGLLPAGRAKSKRWLLRVGGYESSHLWLEVISKCALPLRMDIKVLSVVLWLCPSLGRDIEVWMAEITEWSGVIMLFSLDGDSYCRAIPFRVQPHWLLYCTVPIISHVCRQKPRGLWGSWAGELTESTWSLNRL